MNDDIDWLHKFINCVPFGADAPQADIERAHNIVTALRRSQPEGEPATEAVLEMAAKECERMQKTWTQGGDWQGGCLECADAIRALKGKGASQGAED